MLNMLLRKERIRRGILQANVSIHRGFGCSNLQVSGGAIDVEGAWLIKESMVKPTLSDGFCVRAFNCYPLDTKTEEILKEQKNFISWEPLQQKYEALLHVMIR